MARSDARLRVDGDTTGFERAMRRIVGASDSAGKSITDNFRQAAGALGVAFSGALFVNWIKGASEAADELGKVSARIGVDTKALAGWRLAASEAGVEFSTLTNTMQAAQVRIGQAALGTGEAAKYIRALGLSARDLAALSPDQALLSVTAALDTIADPAQRAAASAAILGEAAKDLAPLLRGGSAAIGEAQAAAEGFGVALDRVDTAKIEMANDALGRVKLAAQGVATTFAVAVAPYIQAFAATLTTAATEGGNLGDNLAQGAKVAYVAFGILKNGVLAVDSAVSQVVALIAQARAASAEFFGMDQEAGIARAIQEQAEARVAANLAGIRSFAELSAEADAIVARATEAATAAANKATENAPGGTVDLGVTFDPAKVSEFNLNFQKTEAERRREALNRDLEAETQIYLEKWGAAREAEADKAREIARQRVIDEEETEARISALKKGAVDKGIAFLQVLGTKHKAAAIAAIAIEKGLALFEIFASTRAAAAKALATYGPTPVGYAAAAAAIAYGAIQAAAVAGAGISQISQAGSAPVGSAANPAFTRESADYGDKSQAGADTSSAIQVVVTGNVGFTPAIIDQIVEGIREATDGRDVVLFSSNSRQALELSPVGG